MKKIIAKNKQELKTAIKEQADIIIIDEALKKEIKPIVRLMKMSNKKIAATIGFLVASGAGIVATIIAMTPTGGTSGIIGAAVGVPAIIAFAASSGVPLSVLVPVILLCVSVGVSSIVQLLRAYDIEEDEFSIEFSGVSFKKRTKYREHKK